MSRTSLVGRVYVTYGRGTDGFLSCPLELRSTTVLKEVRGIGSRTLSSSQAFLLSLASCALMGSDLVGSVDVLDCSLETFEVME